VTSCNVTAPASLRPAERGLGHFRTFLRSIRGMDGVDGEERLGSVGSGHGVPHPLP
jgi:hypothetical protein